MIKKLRLKNFLSYKEATIDFKDFNVILGANASGKTNLTKALIIIKDLINGGHQSLEDFDAFMESVFNKNADESESMEVEIVVQNLINLDLVNKSQLKSEDHYYKVAFTYGKGITEEKYSIGVRDIPKRFRVLDRNEKRAKYSHEYLKELGEQMDDKLFELVRFQTLAGKAFASFLPVLQQAFCDNFLTYNLYSGHLIRPHFSRNQKILATNGQNLAGVLEYYKEHNPVVIESINEILRRNIPNFDFVDTKPLGISKNVYFVVREKDGKDYVLNELSEGTDLFIGLITAMVTSQYLEVPKGTKGILIIEEPEKNLHPQLMEELVSVAKLLTDKFQVIMTTHSTDLVAHLDVEDLILLDKTKDGTRQQRIKRSEELDSFLEEFSLDQIWLNNDLGGGTIYA